MQNILALLVTIFCTSILCSNHRQRTVDLSRLNDPSNEQHFRELIRGTRNDQHHHYDINSPRYQQTYTHPNSRYPIPSVSNERELQQARERDAERMEELRKAQIIYNRVKNNPMLAPLRAELERRQMQITKRSFDNNSHQRQKTYTDDLSRPPPIVPTFEQSMARSRMVHARPEGQYGRGPASQNPYAATGLDHVSDRIYPSRGDIRRTYH
jgi:hypothetical protein